MASAEQLKALCAGRGLQPNAIKLSLKPYM